MEDFTKRIARVREDREHGSRWLVYETISILYELATSSTGTQSERTQRLLQAGQELVHARPAMAAIALELEWVFDRIKLLHITCAPAILKIIDAFVTHENVLNAAKVDPDM